jgi:glutamate 5-kinase
MMKQRIVIKVGTSSLLMSNEQPRGTFETVAEGVKELSDKYDVVLVTSGAIGFGVRQLGFKSRPKEVSKLQAFSAMGQVGLMSRWQEAFHRSAVAQVLLTARELQESGQVQTLGKTLAALWDLGAIPIVNENDAITNEEITFGDNDKLAALVATSIGAQQLVLLTDQDGIQENFGTSAQRGIRYLSLLEAGQHINQTVTDHGTGGMESKLAAAQIALDNDIETYIGSANNSITGLLAGNFGTRIVQ